jgi:hypothetical protein
MTLDITCQKCGMKRGEEFSVCGNCSHERLEHCTDHCIGNCKCNSLNFKKDTTEVKSDTKKVMESLKAKGLVD